MPNVTTERVPLGRLRQHGRSGRWHRTTAARARGGRQGGLSKRLRRRQAAREETP